jgi:regulator of RNase E activity RraA
MLNQEISMAFQDLSTPVIADACLRLDLALRLAPAGIRPILPCFKLAGCVLPVQHFGSVDIFLEALDNAEPGDVLVIDNGGRLEQSGRKSMIIEIPDQWTKTRDYLLEHGWKRQFNWLELVRHLDESA